jgi:tRNA uridine 5-carboxymethylaminomethyl modification enzyme
MFTSRAEHRLLLRIDNADLRLTWAGRKVGLVNDQRWERFQQRRGRFLRNSEVVRSTRVKVSSGDRVPADRALKQPDIRVEGLVASGELKLEIDPRDAAIDMASVETEFKYEGYLRQQIASVDRQRRQEGRSIPAGFAFAGVPGLSREMVQRLTELRPTTLGHASRIPGVTPAAVAVIAAFIQRKSAPRSSAAEGDTQS